MSAPSPRSPDETPSRRRRRPFSSSDRAEKRRDPDGGEHARRLGLVASAVVFFALYAGGTLYTWESTCSYGMVTYEHEMSADPTSTLGRFCLGETPYEDNHHFALWPIPLLVFGVVGYGWVTTARVERLARAWVVGALLAFLYYSPFLLLPR